MARYPDEFINQVKNSTDILELISSYVAVQKKGRDYWACCPFHLEKTPSFVINQAQQYYKCFGCQKSGNVFSFLMDYEKFSFIEAVEYLAQRANIPLPEQTYDEGQKERKELAKKLYDINLLTAQFYHKNLCSEAGAVALQYLVDRGLTVKTIKKFGIGVSLDFDTLPKYLQSKGYALETIIKAGVVGYNEEYKRASDFFGTRIVIPIIDIKGNVIAFTGRTMKKDPDFAKYKNTPGTLIFNKRKNLFNLNKFRKVSQTGSRKLILVEGHMDVISLTQAGVENCVASMGTALTEEQCRDIKRNADVVYVSFDGDSAGQSATLRGLNLLREQNLDVKVVELTDGLDPDDYVKKYGKDGYLRLVESAVSLVDFQLKKVAIENPINSYEDRNKYAVSAMEVLSKLTEVEREVYVKEVSKISGIKVDTLLEGSIKTTSTITPQAVKTENSVDIISKANQIASRFVLASLLLKKDYVKLEKLDINLFYQEEHKKIYTYIFNCIKYDKNWNMSDVFDILENSQESSDVASSLDNIQTTDQESYYKASMTRLYNDYIKKENVRLIQLLKLAKDQETIKLITNQIMSLKNVQPN